MGKCCHCNIEVLDESCVCPLCNSVLEPTQDLEDMYPNVRVRIRRLLLFSRIYLFAAIVLEAVLLGINLLFPAGIWWSVLVGLAFLSGYIVLRYAILGKSGYKSKVCVLALAAVCMVIAVDFVTGYRGWSVDYVMPAGILLVDLAIIICMIINHRNWQSYLMWQILMVLCSFVPAGLYWSGLERNPYMAFCPLAVSITLFLGTFIIGNQRACTELKRRFHIN